MDTINISLHEPSSWFFEQNMGRTFSENSHWPGPPMGCAPGLSETRPGATWVPSAWHRAGSPARVPGLKE